MRIRSLRRRITGSEYSFSLCLLAACAASFLTSCGGSGTQEITESRTVKNPPAPTVTTGAIPANMSMPAPAAAYSGTAPESWQVLPTTANRMANFKVDSEADAECYLSVLSGTGGGGEANLNRWRAQLSLDPLAPGAMAELPTVPVLGQDAALVEIEGAYSGMGGGDGKEGYKLLGIILEDHGNAVFVKMTGPAAVVDREKENFIAYCQSLEPAATHTHTAMQLPEGHPEIGAGTMPVQGQSEMQLPEGHPEVGDVAGLAPGMRDDTSVVRSWTAPESWTQAADKPMRIVTFTMGDSGKSECYVTSLSGPAGGVEANINRWRQQMGQAPLDGPALAELPALTILGRPSPTIEISGNFTDMDGQGGDAFALLGAICPLGDETLFVKMTGPASEIEANKDEFAAFCESLQ